MKQQQTVKASKAEASKVKVKASKVKASKVEASKVKASPLALTEKLVTTLKSAKPLAGKAAQVHAGLMFVGCAQGITGQYEVREDQEGCYLYQLTNLDTKASAKMPYPVYKTVKAVGTYQDWTVAMKWAVRLAALEVRNNQ